MMARIEDILPSQGDSDVCMYVCVLRLVPLFSVFSVFLHFTIIVYFADCVLQFFFILTVPRTIINEWLEQDTMMICYFQRETTLCYLILTSDRL